MTNAFVINAQADRDFLLELERGLVDAKSAREALAFACERLGRFLHAAAAGFLELEADGVEGFIATEWLSGDINSMGGRHRVIEYGSERLASLKNASPFVVADVDTHPLTSPPGTREAIRQLGVRAFVEMPLVVEGDLRGWLYISCTAPHAWTDRELELVAETLQRTWQIFERARANERLREREARMEAVLEQMPVGVILASIPEGNLLLYNRRSSEIMGHDMLGANLADYGTYGGIHKDGSAYSAEEYPTARAVLSGERIIGEPLIYRRPDGSVVQLSVSASPIATKYGDFAVCTFTDETALHEALQRERLLAAELSHRVKNVLATVQAIAAQTVSSRDERDTFDARLQALSNAHDLVTDSTWSGGLQELVARAVQPFAVAGRIEARGADIPLRTGLTTSLALALHELATNACKYGALSNGVGRVLIQWDLEEQNRFRLEWRETDGPPVKQPSRRGFGSRLLLRGLAADLAGEVQLTFDPEGVVCTIIGAVAPSAEPGST